MKLFLCLLTLLSAAFLVRVDAAEVTKCATKPFEAKVFLVTGASSGIGAAVARELARDGALVVLAARRAEKLEKLAAEIKSFGGRAAVAVMDVLDFNSVERVVNNTITQHGRLDGAFNNAGGGGLPMRVGDADLAVWKKVFELNVYGTLNCMRAEIAAMISQGKGGSIVNNLSMLAKKAMKTQSHYAASKAAVLAVQQHAALEHASDGLRINSVSPGFALPSEALDAFLSSMPAGMEKKFHTPQGRIIDAVNDIYPSVAMLLDDSRARSLNGMDIPVSGGMGVDEFALNL